MRSDESTVQTNNPLVQCPRCEAWGPIRMPDKQAVVVALQLLVAATNMPVEMLWPVLNRAEEAELDEEAERNG